MTGVDSVEPKFDEDLPEWDAEYDCFRWIEPLGPDPLGSVLEVDTLMAIVAADRFRAVDAFHRDALADAARAGRSSADVVERATRLELAAALRVTEYTAGQLLVAAEALVHRYPVVLDALGGARITERHAQLLVDALDGIEPEHRDDLLAAGLVLAQAQPVGTFRRGLRTLAERLRRMSLEERHGEAVHGRRVIVEPDRDGMAWLSAYLPHVEATAIMNRLTGIGKAIAAVEGETRTLDQIRADAFGDLLIDGHTDCLSPVARGIRASVVVTVPALTLLTGDAVDGDAMPVVEGVGPIPVSRAQELCGGADGWMRVLTHPETGMVLSVGRDLYRAPAGLRRLVKWRADRCMGPGCGMPASRCEIDHSIAWEHGGDTSLANHAPLCKGHHTVKHHGGWTLTQVGGGAIEWTSPAGRRYLVEPERKVPVFTVQRETAPAAPQARPEKPSKLPPPPVIPDDPPF